MIERICHIGPALNVQGGISSVLVSYKKLFNLSDEHFLSSYNGSFFKSLPRLFFVCLKLLFGSHKRFEFYQIHTASYGSFFRKYLISLCLRIRHKPYTVHVHGSFFDQFSIKSPKIIQCLIRSYCGHSVSVICITEDMKIFLESFLNRPASFAVIPNPSISIKEKPKDLNNDSDLVKVIFSGRYGKRKGVFDLIEAFNKAHFNYPVELHLYGDGEEEKLKTIVKSSPKEKMIKVNSWINYSEYLERLMSYDLLVLPSYAETFGMSLVEAMGFGIPVISTQVGGISYVVENNVCGVLIKPGDIPALTSSLEKLINDKGLRIKMGYDAWKHVSTHFTKNIILDKIEELYITLS